MRSWCFWWAFVVSAGVSHTWISRVYLLSLYLSRAVFVWWDTLWYCSHQLRQWLLSCRTIDICWHKEFYWMIHIYDIDQWQRVWEKKWQYVECSSINTWTFSICILVILFCFGIFSSLFEQYSISWHERYTASSAYYCWPCNSFSPFERASYVH